mmetsp:Transcript_102518/g.290327  ORF Transcript_102518/g.290327 Transcript_102518/m.290327 type:complete len:239 (-) Transcript_102518:178-894(-)
MVAAKVAVIRPLKSLRKRTGLHAMRSNSFLCPSSRVSWNLAPTQAMLRTKHAAEQRNARAPLRRLPRKGPRAQPRPKKVWLVLMAIANCEPEKTSVSAAFTGAWKVKTMAAVMIRSTYCTAMEPGRLAASVWRTARTAGARSKNGLRPYLSLRRPKIGFRKTSSAAPHEDMNPNVRAAAAASPFLIANTIGALAGRIIMTAVMKMPFATHSEAAAASLAAPLSSFPLFSLSSAGIAGQ